MDFKVGRGAGEPCEERAGETGVAVIIATERAKRARELSRVLS
jgi:hypothetical protein